MGSVVGRITSLKKYTVHEVVWVVPLAQLFLLWTENEVANGAVWADPSYEDQDMLDDTADAVKDLRNHWHPAAF